MHHPKTLLSNPNPNHSSAQIIDHAGHQDRGSSTGEQASMFANAKNVLINGGTFNNTINITEPKPALQELYQRVSPNAILNEGGRADDAKCHPGTRDEVIGLIERWMDASENSRILWMSGPAGGGKTAIMKTITERAANRGAHTVNFFFFRGDSSRNSAQPVIPTLLYQLFELYPPSLEAVANVIAVRARVLDGSITQQCNLISALFPIIRQSSPTEARIVLLIDGLDECDVDAERSQSDILRALEGLVTEADSPFCLLVASRPEARIKLAFNRLTTQAETIFLDEEYLPEKDIRLFVNVEFDRIKELHPSAHLLPHPWPSLSDVEEIVTKSSGQFIYAATVMRYLAQASAVPSLSLERVKGIVPAAKNSPFAHLDSIYYFILSRADDEDAMQNMMSMALLQQHTFLIDLGLKNLLLIHDSRYTPARVESCATELSAIVQLTKMGNLKFYHASLPDFLIDKARSGTYWIDVSAFRAKVLLAAWEMPVIKLLDPHRNLQEVLFNDLEQPTPEITHALLNLPFSDWTIQSPSRRRLERDEIFSERGQVFGALFMKDIQRLYYWDHIKVYKHILRRFIHMLVFLNLRPPLEMVPYAKQYLLFYRRLNWWFNLLNIVRRKMIGRKQSNSG